MEPIPKWRLAVILSGILLAMFMSSIHQTIVDQVLPDIIGDLGGFSRYSWVNVSYLIILTVTIPITGKLIDVYGRKSLYLIGLVIFAAGSLMAGLSRTIIQLILLRGFQGIGAGIMIVNAYTVVGDLFPPEKRGKYQGLVTGVFGLSAIAGPVLGGIIVDNLSWHWVFFINIPLAITVTIIFTFFFPRLTLKRSKHQLDYTGMLALVLSVISLMGALFLGGTTYPWLSTVTISLLAFSVAMGIAFIIIEARSLDSIFPLSLLRNRTIIISNAAIFLAGIGLFSSIAFVPLLLKGVIGLSTTASGSLLAPMMSGMVIGSILSGQSVGRGNYRLQGLFGLTIGAMGIGLLSFVTAETGFARIIANTIMACFGTGILLPLYATAIQNEVPHKILGMATASYAFFSFLGEALGWTVLGSAMNHRFTSEFYSNLSPETRTVISQEPFSNLVKDPQLLLDPQSQTQLRELLTQTGQHGLGVYDQILQAMREALNSALSEIFFVGFILVVAALIMNLFIKNRKPEAITGDI